MARILTALAIGMIFGAGIAISGMINPAKVLNFFDIAGHWDPSLALVMVGALATAMIGYRFVFGKFPKPVLNETYALPTNTKIDIRLISGSAMFGIGWGIAGFCPGASIPALGIGEVSALIFFLAMTVGIFFARTVYNAMNK